MPRFKTIIDGKEYDSKGIEKLFKFAPFYHINKKKFKQELLTDKEYNKKHYREYWSRNVFSGYQLVWFANHFKNYIRERKKVLSIPLLKHDMLINMLSNYRALLMYNNRSKKHWGDYYTIDLHSNSDSSVVVQRELDESLEYVDWNCAITNKPIKSKIGEFDIDNLVHHSILSEVKNSKYVAKEVLESSLKFREYCENLYLESYEKIQESNKENIRKVRNVINLLNSKINKEGSNPTLLKRLREYKKVYQTLTGKSLK